MSDDYEERLAAAAAAVVESHEEFIAALLKYGIDTWEKVEQYGMDEGDDGTLRILWEMRVGT